MEWYSILPSVIALLTACGWFVDGRLHRKKVKEQDIRNRQEEMELSKTYVAEFKENIAKPLQDEIKGLRRDVKNLRKAINTANSCPHSDDCPVLDELQKQSDDDCGPKKRGQNRDGAEGDTLG